MYLSFWDVDLEKYEQGNNGNSTPENDHHDHGGKYFGSGRRVPAQGPDGGITGGRDDKAGPENGENENKNYGCLVAHFSVLPR